MKAISNKIKAPQLTRRMSTVINPEQVKVIIDTKSKSSVPAQKIILPEKAKTVDIPKVSNVKIYERPKQIAIPKNKTVKYITTDTSQEHIEKIKNLYNKGEGRILVVIGNGPSINEIDIARLKTKDIDILSINKPDPRLWPTKYWSFYDPSQLTRHNALIDSYTGIIFNSTSIKLEKQNNIKFKNMAGHQYSKDLTKGLCIGRSSCYAAMQIASWMAYDEVYIFGVDMDPEGIDGKLHFYGTNPDVKPELRKTRFKDEALYYDHAAKVLDQTERSKFYFCSSYNKWSFVDRFNKLDHKEAMDLLLAK